MWVDGWMDNFKAKENAKQIMAEEQFFLPSRRIKTFVLFLLPLYFPPLYLLVEFARSSSENTVSEKLQRWMR